MSETNINEQLEAEVEEQNPMENFRPEKKEKSKLPSVVEIMERGFDSLEMDDSTFEELSLGSVQEIKEDELVQGKIVKITKDEIHVDIGFKSLGVVPRGELINAETYKVGDEIDVFIEKIEDSNGKLILSRRRADFMKIWEDILRLFDKQEVTKVKILRRIKGGMVVDLHGIEAFLPGSQIDVRPVRDFDAWVGNNIDVKVVKVNHPNENVVVSHKVLLEEQLAEQRHAIMSKLEKGLVLEGTVKAIADFGVFVDLGGVDGLVHITDLSWGRVTHPSEIVDLDETVKVVVLDFDEGKKRISLGMKQLTTHPWDEIGAKYEQDSKVSGKVVSLTDYGAFIEIEKGIEGLIHISEMSWTQHVKHPSQIVSMGQVVEAVVLNIDKDSKKLALGMKQLEPDPWEDLMKKYPVDSVHDGIVRNLTNFGVFVELEPGVDGLVHISDLSWTKKIRHPGEFVKKGDDLKVVVLSIDPEQRRIALGHKQISDNPWDVFSDKYAVAQETEARIERIIEKGVIVELPDGVDGFVPVSQLSFAPIKNISEYFKIGDMLPLKVVEFDKDSKKIVLSAVEALRGKDPEIVNTYNTNHPVPNADKYANEPITMSPEDFEIPSEYLDQGFDYDIKEESSKLKSKKEEEANEQKVEPKAEAEANENSSSDEEPKLDEEKTEPEKSEANAEELTAKESNVVEAKTESEVVETEEVAKTEEEKTEPEEIVEVKEEDTSEEKKETKEEVEETESKEK